MQGTPSTPPGSQALPSPGDVARGVRSPHGQSRGHTVLATPCPCPPVGCSLPHHPATFLSLIRLPVTLHRSPTCSLPPGSARGWFCWSRGMGQPRRSLWPSQLPRRMHPDKSLCNRVLRGASSQAHFHTVGHQHSQPPSITLLLGPLDPQTPRLPLPGSLLSLHEPPRFSPTRRPGTATFQQPQGGCGLGRGALESQMLFLGSPESLPADSTPGAVWPGVAKPQVCPRRLPGGASLKAVVGEPTQDSGHPPPPGAPARPLPQMGLEF